MGLYQRTAHKPYIPYHHRFLFFLHELKNKTQKINPETLAFRVQIYYLRTQITRGNMNGLDAGKLADSIFF